MFKQLELSDGEYGWLMTDNGTILGNWFLCEIHTKVCCALKYCVLEIKVLVIGNAGLTTFYKGRHSLNSISENE